MKKIYITSNNRYYSNGEILITNEEIKGVWLDSFESIWYDKDLILNHTLNNKKVCIV